MPSGRLAGAELNPLLASPFVRGRWGVGSPRPLPPLAKAEVARVAPSVASPLPRGRLVGVSPLAKRYCAWLSNPF
jgi:hypothetical protein